ncbi:MAG TPA: 50S ribosomal protein L11 methyltransferase [Gemmatimonadaceae bacterium]|nr:50S ribosomal protein L11 methyltransferase [Gemmatimonadaceae bacterium]
MIGPAPALIHWQTIRVCAGDEASREAMVAALIAAGAGGVEERGQTLITHVPGGTDLSVVYSAASALTSVRIETEELGIVDWSTRWPTRVGIQRVGAITIAPPWLADEAASEGSHLVVIEPAMAFGTGEHETTRGVVRLLQRTVQPGDSVADLGAGSAVLAICAIKLGARRAFAIEMDEDAIPNAEENTERNGVADRVAVLHGDAFSLLPVVAPVRIIVANIISTVLVRLSPVMRGALAPRGVAILSGVLRTERSEVLGALREDGWQCLEEDAEGDWWSGIVAPA